MAFRRPHSACASLRAAGTFAALALAACGGSAKRADSTAPAPSIEPHVLSVERVSPTTTFFHRDDGTTRAVITAGPRAFRGADGAWHDIDTTPRVEGGALVADENLLGARFPQHLGGGAQVRFTAPGGGFGWRPLWAAGGYSADASLAGDTVTYAPGGALAGATESFHVLRGGVKHLLELADAGVLDRALARGPGGTLAVRGLISLDAGLSLAPHGGAAGAGGFVTSGPIDVLGPRGRALELPAPIAWDSAGARTGAAYRWDPASGVLAVELPEAWLRSPERAFPISIDPPATALSTFSAELFSFDGVNGNDIFGPNALRLGELKFGTGPTTSYEYYLDTFKFDISAISSTSTINSVAVNVWFATSGQATTTAWHFGKITLDPQVAGAAAAWTDALHGTNPDYTVLGTAQSNNCGCWINGGNPATQTGTALGGTAVSDVQNDLNSGVFLLGMHPGTFTAGQEAEPNGTLDANEPQLYVDFTTGVPSVSLVSPESGTNAAAQTVTVLGTNFKGQTGTTAVLTPVGGGASTAVTVTYVSAGEIRIAVPAGLAVGVYDVVVTTANGSSTITPADHYTVLGAAKTWAGTLSTSWNTAGNWSPSGVPDATTDVTIPSGTPFAPTVDAPGGTVHGLSLTGGTLSSGGQNVTVWQDLNISSGTLDMTAGGTLFLSGNNFLNSGIFTAGTGTVNFNSSTNGRQNFVATGKVFFDDFERGQNGWAVSTTAGSPLAWTLEEKFWDSAFHAWFQQGQQLTMGASALASPTFSLVGKTTATLRWKHRYRIDLEGGSGPNTGDGFVVQVSTDGGTTWTSIGPTTTDTSPHAQKTTATKCAVGGGTRTDSGVATAPGGMYAGMQTGWVQDSVSLTPYVGNGSVKVRFWSGWDNCNDYSPWEGAYVDNVVVTADESTITFNNLTLSNTADVTAITPLNVAGNLDVSTTGNTLDVNGAGLTVGGTANNAGVLTRGPSGPLSVGGALTNSGTFNLGSGNASFGPVTNTGTVVGGAGNITAGAVTSSGPFSTGDGTTTLSGDLSVTGANFTVRGTALTVGGNLANSGVLDLAAASLTLNGAGAYSISGTGSYRESTNRTNLLYDGFEADATGACPTGWTCTAGGSPPDAQVVATPAGTSCGGQCGVGTKVASLAQGNAWVDNWITRGVSTAGLSGIWISYGRATTTTAGTYSFDFDFSVDGGSSWTAAKTVAGTFSYATDTINLSAIDPRVENNPNFQIRFHSYRSTTGNFHYVDEVTLQNGTDGVGPLTINGGGSYSVTPSNATNDLKIRGAVTLSSGSVAVQAGKALVLDNPGATTSTTSAGTTLTVNPSATLKLSANSTLNVGGTLALSGTNTAARAAVTTTDTVTPGRYALNVGGTFNGNWYSVSYPNATGLDLQAGATVSSLDNGSFHYPAAGGALLTLGATALPATATGCDFNNDAAVAGPFNVDGSLNNTAIRFHDATGNLQGESFDKDFGGATPGNVTWSYSATQAVVQSATEPAPGNANSVVVTIQTLDQYGNPSIYHPNYTANVTVNGSAGVVGSPISIPSGASSTTVTVNDTRAEVVNVTLTETSATTLTEVNGTVTFIPGPASQVGFVQQPSSTVAGQSITPAVTAAIQDAWGNTITTSSATITLAIGTNPGGGTLSGTTSAAAASGVATFSNLSINKTGSGYTLSAASAGLTNGTSAAFNITPAAASQLVFTTQPSTTLAGASISPAVAVSVEDAFGNVVTSSSASITVAIGTNPGGGTLSGTATVAATAGVASFANLSINRTGTGYTLTAASAPLPNATSAAFNITPAAAAKLAFTVQPSSAVAGVAIAPAIQVTVQDQFGNTVTSSTASITVAIGTNPGGGTLSGTSTSSAVSGVASFSTLSINKAGSGYTLTASSGTLTAATSAAFNITPAAANQLAFVQQPTNTVAGAAISPAVTVAVQDQFGNTVTTSTATVAVAIGTNPGGGTLSGASSVSAVAGLATFSSLSIDKAGAGYTLVASSTGLTNGTSAGFNVTPAAASRLAFLTPPSNTVAGAAISPAVQVVVQDQFGNTVTSSAASITVAIGTNPGGGALSGTLTVAASAGVATFSNLSINKTGVGYTLTAASGTLTGATSGPFNVTPAAASALAFTVQPSNAVAGAAISPAVQVTVQDAYGNTVTTSSASITVAIGANPGGGTLGGTVTVAAVSGVASFSTLSINKTGVGYTLTAASSPLTGATSSPFNITPAAANKLAFSGQPTNAVAGTAISPAVTVTVQDQYGNTVTSSAASITLAIGTNPGGGTLSGTATAAAVSGVATFSTLSIDKTGTGYTLTAASTGLTGATSTAFNVTPAAASKLAFTVQPSNAVAGAAIAPAVQVTVQDQYGNTVTASTATVSVAIGANPGGGTLSGTASLAATAGVASFSALSINKTGTGYTLAASSTGLAGATSTAFNITPAAASQLAFTVQPTGVTAGSSIAPAVQVTVQDQFGNTVTTSTASVTVAIGANPGGGTLSGTATVSATAGVATFSNLSINKAGAGYTLTAASSPLTGATSAAFNVTPAAASQLAFVQQPTSAVAGASIAPAVTVAVQDQYGNTVTTSTASVTVAIGTNPGGGTLSGTATVSAVSGVASFSTLSINKTGSGYTLAASSSGLSGATSAAFNITPASATQLAFTAQPSNAVAGAIISPAVQVAVQDQYGNTVTGSSATIALAIAANPGGGTLAGTTSAAASAGVATFSNLSINKTGTGYTLAATSTGLTGATSAAFSITPGAATQLAFTVQPSSTPAGSSITPAVQISVEDALGNVVTSSAATITVAIGTNPAGGTLTGTLSAAASAGVASFSNLSIDKTGTGYTLAAASAPLTGATSAAFDITPGSSTKLAFTVQPTNTVAGAAIAPAVQVAVQDNLGNTVTTDSTTVITVGIGTNPGGGTLSGTTSVTVTSGVASFPTLSIDKTGTGYTLLATASGKTNATSAAFNVTPAAANKVVFTAQPSNVVAGASIAPAVQAAIEDTYGNVVTTSSATITVAIGANPGGGTLTGTTSAAASSGVASFANLAINKVGAGYTLTAASVGLATGTSATFNVTPAAASQLAFTVQPTSATAGAAIAPAVQVTVQDQYGNTVTGSSASVALAIGANPGGGTLAGTTTVAAVSGVATFSTLSINKAGNGYTLAASSTGLTGATSATFDITPAAASKLAFTVQPSNVVAGAGIAPAVQVTVQDQYGNTVTSSTATIAVAIGTNPGGGTLSGAASLAATAGVASFANLSINLAGAGYTLTASSAPLTGATSAAFNVTPAAANKLAITVQPSSAVAGAAIAPAVQVTVQDQYGNTVTSSAASVTAAIGTNPGGGTLSGTATVAAVSGVASFSTLGINKTGAGYTLAFTSAGLTGATSAAFDITPAPASKLAFTTQPTSAVAGVAIAPAVVVAVQDQFGNTVTSSSASVTVAIGTNPSSGTLSGTLTVAASSGVATFGSLSIDKAGTGYTLTAASGALTGATSTPFNITPAAASQLAFTVQPTSAAAGASITPAVQVTVQDQFGNTVTASTATIAVAIGTNPSGGALSGTASAAASGGVASFANLSINLAGTGYTLAASSGALAGATSAPFDVTPAAATRLAFQVQPSNAVAGAAIAPAVQVAVQDQFGNTVTSSTATVALSISVNPGGGTLSGTASVAAVGGVATFSTLSIDKTGTGYKLAAASGALTGASSAAFNVTPAPASKLAFTAQPSNVVAGAAVSPAVQVAIQDQFGNTVTTSSATVTVAIGTNPGGGTLSGSSALSASAGVATFSNLSIDKAGAGYTLTAASGTLTGATSATFDVTPATATTLAFTVQPSSAVAGVAISPAVQVTVRDNYGNTVTSSSATIAIAIASNPGGGTLSGTASAAASSGVATFSNLSIDKTGAGYTLGATSTGLTAATSTAFDVTPAGATRLAFQVQPANTVAGAAIAPAVQVAVQDQFGNVVTSSAASIAVAIGTNPGGATLGGTTTQAAASGVATFANLSITKAASGYTLTAASGTLTPATSVGFDVTPAPASKLAFSVQPTTATAGAAIAPAVVVLVQDQYGNTVTTSTATIAVAIGANPGGGTLSGASSLAASGGQATYSNLSIDKTGTGYTLAATSSPLTPATSASFDVVPASAAALAFTVQPSNVSAGAPISPAVRVAVEDQFGNVVTSSTATIAVALAANPGGATLSGTKSLAATAGVATFSGLSLDKMGAGYTLGATSAPLTGATSSAFNVTPAAPAQLVVTSAPKTQVAGTCSSGVTVQAVDSFGNPSPVAADTAINLGSTSVANTFFSDACTTVANAVLMTAGTSTATFYFNDTKAGSPTETASSGSLLPAQQIEAITPAAASKIAFSSAAQTVTATACSSAAAVVEARDAFDNPTTVGAATTVSLSSTQSRLSFFSDAACGAGVTTVSIPAGQGNAGFWFDGSVAGTWTVTAATTTLGNATQDEKIVPAGPAKLAFVTPARAVVAGLCSPLVTVQTQDTPGNPAPVPVDTTVTVSAPAPAAIFSDSACTTPATTFTILSGTTDATLYFSSTLAGPLTLTAASGGLVSGTQTETITPAPAAQLAFTTAPQSLVAGSCSGSATVEAEDGYGNPSPVGADTALALASTSAGNGFFTDACVTPAAGSAVTLTAGTSSVTFHFRDTASGTPTLTASATLSGPASVSQQETISPAAADHVLTTASPASAAASSPFTLSFQVQDAFGNPSPTPTPLQPSLPAGCTLTPASITSDATGAASATLTCSIAGSYGICTSAPSLPGQPVCAAITVTPRPPDHVQVALAATSATAGQTVTPDTAQVQDALGNPSPGAVAITLTATGAANFCATDLSGATGLGTGTLTGATDAAGHATFDLCDTKAQSVDVTATFSGQPGASNIATVVFNPGPPDHARVTTAGPTRLDACTAANIAVAVVDAYDNVVPAVATVTLCADAATSATIASTTLANASASGSCVTGDLDATGNATAVVGDTQPQTSTFTATGSGLAGAPAALALTWQVGPVSLSHSLFTFDEGASPQALTTRTGTLHARLAPRDACDLPVALTTADVAVTADPLLSAGAATLDGTNGTFVFAVTLPSCPANPGNLLPITAQIQGQDVVDGGGAPVKLEVQPVCVAPDPVASTVQLLDGDTATACFPMQAAPPAGLSLVTLRLLVTPIDVNGVGMGPGQSVSVAPDGELLKPSAAVDNGDGTYTVTIGSNHCDPATAHAAVVSVNGTQLATQPALTFTCAPVDAAASLAATATKPADGRQGADKDIELDVTGLDVCTITAFGRPLAVTVDPAALADVVSPPAALDANGQAAVTLRARAPGAGNAAISVDGTPIGDKPISFIPTARSAALTIVASSAVVRPGQEVGFTVTIDPSLPIPLPDMRLDYELAGLRLVGGSWTRDGKAAAMQPDGLPQVAPLPARGGAPVVVAFRAVALTGATRMTASVNLAAAKGSAPLSNVATATLNEVGGPRPSGCSCGFGDPAYGALALLLLGMARRRRRAGRAGRG